MLDLQTKCCPRPSASGNILSSGPTYHMLPSSPVNNCIVCTVSSIVQGNDLETIVATNIVKRSHYYACREMVLRSDFEVLERKRKRSDSVL